MEHRNMRNFTGTNWQQDTPMGTRWQQKGVYNNFGGGGMTTGISTMSVAHYALGLASVGILFFVIGYGYAEGKKAA